MKYYLIKGGFPTNSENYVELTEEELKQMMLGITKQNLVITTYPPIVPNCEWVDKIRKVLDNERCK